MIFSPFWRFFSSLRRAGLVVLAVVLIQGFFVGTYRAEAQIQACTACTEPDCTLAAAWIEAFHENYEDRIVESIPPLFDKYRTWVSGQGSGGGSYFHDSVLKGLVAYTEQMSAVGMYSLTLMGQLFDAKHQLETQLLHQELAVEAHHDYQPSEMMCAIGTNVRSLAASEQKMSYNMAALGAIQMSRQMGNANTGGAESRQSDKAARWAQFIVDYCDPTDNAWLGEESGLELACPKAASAGRENLDVNYTKLIENKRTLDVDFTDDQVSSGEADVLALQRNLIGHEVLTRQMDGDYLGDSVVHEQNYYLLRSVAAKRSVAQHLLNGIVALKAGGAEGMSDPADSNTAAFMAQILVQLGMSRQEAQEVLGENPSYYAQLEALTKLLPQSPNFYASLYDTSNIEQKRVALKAMDLMLDRSVYESELRQEMALSVLLSSLQNDKFREVNRDFTNMKESKK